MSAITDTTMVSFRKRKRGLRRRGQRGPGQTIENHKKTKTKLLTSDVEKATLTPGAVSRSSKKSKKKKTKKKKATGNITLSFNSEVDDQEEYVFKLKKSRASRQLARQVRHGQKLECSTAKSSFVPQLSVNHFDQSTSVKNEDTDSVRKNASYSPEALEKLRQQQQRSNAKSLKVLHETKKQKEVLSNGSYLSKGQKKQTDKKEVGEEKMFEREQVERVKRDKARRRAALTGDFIPLSDGATFGLDEGNSRTSRLEVRDIVPKFLQRAKRLDDMVESTDGNTKDVNDVKAVSAATEWELQQVRRATGESHLVAASESSLNTHTNLGRMSSARLGTSGCSSNSKMSSTKQILAHQKFLTTAQVRSLISTQISELKNYEKQDDTKLKKLQNAVESMKSDVVKLEHLVSESSAQYVLFQEMSNYVRNLCACVNDKQGKIVDICSAMHRARSRVTSDRMRRKEASFAAHIRILKRRGVIFDLGGPKLPITEEQIYRGADKFGRDLSTVAMQRDLTVVSLFDERMGDAVRRWWNIDIKDGDEFGSLQTTGPRNEPCMSEEELGVLQRFVEVEQSLEQQDATYRARAKELLGLKNVIFKDAAEDYCCLPHILKIFRRWRNSARDSFTNTFAIQGLAEIVSTNVQLDMLAWDPLGLDNEGFENRARSNLLKDFDWYRNLAQEDKQFEQEVKDLQSKTPVGAQVLDMQQTPNLDKNHSLLCNVTERAVIPLLVASIADLWDLTSESQTSALISCIKELQTIGITDGAMGKVKDALARRVQFFLRNFRLPFIRSDAAIYKSNKGEGNDTNVLSRTFSTYCFGQSVMLLRNLCKLHATLPGASLRAAVWSTLVTKQISFAQQMLTSLSRLANDEFMSGNSIDTPCFYEVEACIRGVRSIFRALPAAWFDDASVLFANIMTSRGVVLSTMRPLLKEVDAMAAILKVMASEGVYRVRRQGSNNNFIKLQDDVARLVWALSQGVGSARR